MASTPSLPDFAVAPADGAAALAVAAAGLVPAPGRSLIFRAGGRVYRCDVEAVREVVPAGPMTPLPGAPAHVPGLINVRGTIVTVVDAGLYIHGARCQDGGSVLLVDVGSRSVGLLVDAVADVRVVRDDEGYRTLDVRATVARVIAISEDE